jgi:outer membrane protein insertion porin family
VLTGFGGYYSDGGVTLRGQVTHRNFFGGARQASVGVEARSGLLATGGQSVTGEPIRDLRASLSLRQPYFFDRRLSLTLQPSVRDRRDEIEASRSAELAATLLYSRRALQTVALSAAGRYRALAAGQRLRLLDPTGVIGSDTLSAASAGLGIDATLGVIDNALAPRRGFVLRPSAAVAGGDVGFVRARLSGTLLRPFGRRAGVAARLTMGTLLAGGGAVASSDIDAPTDYLLLRDQLFYAGGTSDVRGWGVARLGPKTLSVIPGTDGTLDTPGDVTFVGIGGTRKVSASLQLNLPLPIGPQWGANLFLDGGGVFGASRVPTTTLLRSTGNVTDASLADVLDAEGGLRAGAGAGLQYLSPVGYITVGLGVKLNPSALDLRTAGAVLCGDDFTAATPECTGGYVGARLAGVPFDVNTVAAHPIRGRLQFHFSIGQTF